MKSSHASTFDVLPWGRGQQARLDTWCHYAQLQDVTLQYTVLVFQCMLLKLAKGKLCIYGYKSGVPKVSVTTPSPGTYGAHFKLQILPLPWEYIFSLLNIVINNLEYLQSNSAIHFVNTRIKHRLHRPAANLTCLQKNTYYSGIKIVNNLPASLGCLTTEKAKFKIALKQYWNAHTSYCVDEFLLPKTESAS
jgi:hypothetical protein